MTAFQFARNDDPRPRARCVPIKPIGATDQLTAVILAPKVWGLDVHWTGGRIQPCRADGTLCNLCLERCPVKWRGYLHCVLQASGEQCFIELTDFAHERLKRVTADKLTLRGLICLFQRERKTVKAPINVSLVGETATYKVLPPERTPEETLKRIWNIRD